VIKTSCHRGFTHITLENDLVRVVLLPEVGGKIISLVRVASAREYLLRLPEDEAFREPHFGGVFVDYNNVGFDECIPTIAPCTYPDSSFTGRRLPDHGDVWSLPWHYEVRERNLLLSVEGRSLPYSFHKRLCLGDQGLKIEYEVRNRSDAALCYLWSAHPLLHPEPGASVLLPLDSATLLVDSSKYGRLGSRGDQCGWPIAVQKDGTSDDLRRIKPHADTSDKLYTPRLPRGCCGLYYPSTHESLLFKFDIESVPYVGIWICNGGTGRLNPKEPYTVALEPCNGRPDSLADAMRRGENAVLSPNQRKRWDLRVELLEGLPAV